MDAKRDGETMRAIRRDSVCEGYSTFSATESMVHSWSPGRISTGTVPTQAQDLYSVRSLVFVHAGQKAGSVR